jgi:hypothetical protein
MFRGYRTHEVGVLEGKMNTLTQKLCQQLSLIILECYLGFFFERKISF